MKKTLLLPILLTPMAVQADVAPESLDGLEVRLVLQDGRLIDEHGDSQEIPEGTNISFAFLPDSPDRTYTYSRLMPAVGVIEGQWWNGSGQWTLYFSSSCEGSATFNGLVDGKPVHYEDVYFVIGADYTPMGVYPGPMHRAGAIHGKRADFVEIVMHPTPEQLEAMKESPYLETDMVFGFAYHPEHNSPDEEAPIVAVRHPGDTYLTWGGWRNRAFGSTQQVCYPGNLSLLRTGDGASINLAPENTLGTARYALSYADNTATFHFETKDGEDKTVEGIPFTVQAGPDDESYRGYQFQKMDGGVFDFPMPVRVCFLDSTVVAVLTGKELVVMSDPEGSLEWRTVYRKPVKPTCPEEAVVIVPNAMEEVYVLLDSNTGKVVEPEVTVPFSTINPGYKNFDVPAPASLKGKRITIHTPGENSVTAATVAFPEDGTKGVPEKAISCVSHALYFPAKDGSSTATLELVNDIPKATMPANRIVLDFKDETSGTARMTVWEHSPHNAFGKLEFRVEPLQINAGELLKEGVDYAYGRKGKPKNPEKALALYLQAAAGEGPDAAEAAYRAARMYRYAIVGEKADPAKARELYTRAAKAGHAKAAAELKQMK